MKTERLEIKVFTFLIVLKRIRVRSLQYSIDQVVEALPAAMHIIFISISICRYCSYGYGKVTTILEEIVHRHHKIKWRTFFNGRIQ